MLGQGLSGSTVHCNRVLGDECEKVHSRRVAIDFQLTFKEKTNTELLEEIICNNVGSDEFFNNKAIGWSLRDYSKINPDWVRDFLMRYKDQLSALSRKEAGKYL